MEISLSKEQWMMKGYWPWVPLKEKSMETGKTLMGVTDWIPATVPGGVHYDLYRAEWIEYPYKDLNSLKCEWVENRWWIYKTTFERPKVEGQKVELIFKGLDYEAVIYLNGDCLGEHKGMYHPAVFDITEYMANQTLELIVLLKGVPEEMGQIGKTSLTRTQKSRFNYKWDFSTHLVNIGIWKDVILKVHQEYSIGDVYVRTDVDEDTGKIITDMELIPILEKQPTECDLKIRAECFDPQGESIAVKEFVVNKGEGHLSFVLNIDNPELWYPNGYGEQPLYKVQFRLVYGDKICDERSFLTGIRKLTYAYNEDSPQNALPYTFVVNGQKIYIKGVNMTPLDHLYGNVSHEHYEHLVRLMKHANMNMVRVWGGGIIEKEIFYDLCDRNGIMVWQEFIQSSSGIDNIPSKQPEFLQLLKESAIAALKEKRNHVSLTVWSGGNELMSQPNTPSTYEDENLAMLKALVEEYDSQRMFLPTSASGPVEFVTKKKGISHDIHGHWHYQGNPEHYALYGQSDNLFHSEFGVDGVSAVKSLRKFLSPKQLKPTPMSGNVVWRHHGEWWGTYFRDIELFGKIDNIELFCSCSQWIQAEGLRFIVEANRRRKFHNSGSIIWQLNEPWPNASCTNLVDYFGECKMAYYWTKKAFAPLHISLSYERLDIPAGRYFSGKIYVHNTTKAKKVTVGIKLRNDKGCVLHEEQHKIFVDENQSQAIKTLQFKVNEQFGRLFYVCLEIYQQDRLVHENTYIFSSDSNQPYQAAKGYTDINVVVKEEGPWETSPADGHAMVRTYMVKNTGTDPALHVYPEETTNAYWLYGEGCYEILFPGQEKKMTVYCLRKKAGGFLEDDQVPAGQEIPEPEIKFKYFGK